MDILVVFGDENPYAQDTVLWEASANAPPPALPLTHVFFEEGQVKQKPSFFFGRCDDLVATPLLSLCKRVVSEDESTSLQH